MNPKSQKARILAYLKKGRIVSTLNGRDLFDCLSVSQRISELRNRPPFWNITPTMIHDKKTGKRYANYKLNVKDPELTYEEWIMQ